MEINEKAPVVVAHESLVRAPLDVVWRLHTDVAGWREWNPDISRAGLDRPLTVNAGFYWETLGRPICSTVREIIHGERLAWSSVTPGLTGIHIWTFAPLGADVFLRTEASWEGSAVASSGDELQQTMDVAIGRWHRHVQLAAEAQRDWSDRRGRLAWALSLPGRTQLDWRRGIK
jgi:hypothetical protein